MLHATWLTKPCSPRCAVKKTEAQRGSGGFAHRGKAELQTQVQLTLDPNLNAPPVPS